MKPGAFERHAHRGEDALRSGTAPRAALLGSRTHGTGDLENGIACGAAVVIVGHRRAVSLGLLTMTLILGGGEARYLPECARGNRNRLGQLYFVADD